MTFSFYDNSVATYLHTLENIAAILEKGAAFAEAGNMDAQDIVNKRLHDTMMPFYFQVVSTAHHSWGAIQGMQSGRFTPPSFSDDYTYAALQALIKEAQDGLSALSVEDVNKLADGNVVFALGEREMPFTNINFLTSFSLPNFYFHATTTYNILRHVGVEIGKLDFLGKLKLGV